MNAARGGRCAFLVAIALLAGSTPAPAIEGEELLFTLRPSFDRSSTDESIWPTQAGSAAAAATADRNGAIELYAQASGLGVMSSIVATSPRASAWGSIGPFAFPWRGDGLRVEVDIAYEVELRWSTEIEVSVPPVSRTSPVSVTPGWIGDLVETERTLWHAPSIEGSMLSVDEEQRYADTGSATVSSSMRASCDGELVRPYVSALAHAHLQGGPRTVQVAEESALLSIRVIEMRVYRDPSVSCLPSADG